MSVAAKIRRSPVLKVDAVNYRPELAGVAWSALTACKKTIASGPDPVPRCRCHISRSYGSARSLFGKASCWALAALMLLGLTTAWSQAASDYVQARHQLIRELQDDFRLSGAAIGQTTMDPAVMRALEQVPRHEFVPIPERDRAYLNQPLPIGFGQTISQPYIVALMTDLLDLHREAVVLEIGTGSGYQAAVLAELVQHVYSIEIIEELGTVAGERLARLGYGNVRTRIGDGYYGWEEHAPFNAIMVTAGTDHIPPPLVRQLKPGGRMVIPVGSSFMMQYLVLVEKDLKGDITMRQLLPVRFVPLTGGH